MKLKTTLHGILLFLLPGCFRLLICLILVLPNAGCCGFSPWAGYRQGF